jgi:hypothetical protein
MANFDLSLAAIIRGHAAPQIYRLASDISAADLAEQLAANRGNLFWLDGELMAETSELMAEFVRDLSWLDDLGTHLVLAIDHWDDCASPILQEILQESVDRWADSATPLYVLLRSSQPDIGRFLTVG